MKKHNFSAGPSILPREVIEETAKAILDFNGSGLSVLEVSHRGKDFQAVMDEAVALFKEILNIPEGYSVLFLGGGASMQFCMVPYNFLEKKAAYLNTGVWAKKAMKEAKGFGEVVEVASSADANYTFIPKDFTIPADADYFHVTTNNTIYGTELKGDLDSPVPMVADMSSDIFSRPVDVSKYICIYGGAQKNLAPSGVTFVIVKDDAVGKVSRYIPSMLNYKTHIDGGSMFNTPPVLPIYSAMQRNRKQNIPPRCGGRIPSFKFKRMRDKKILAAVRERWYNFLEAISLNKNLAKLRGLSPRTHQRFASSFLRLTPG